MQRRPEPELMEDLKQAVAYSQADFSDPHNMFIEKFGTCFSDPNLKSNVLDIGCGPADITIRFAHAYPDCQIDGVDGSSNMLQRGEEAISKSGLTGRIDLIEGILPQAELPKLKYDVIISNSLLHHLHNPDVLWEFIKRYSQKKTRVFIMDLLRPDNPETVANLVDIYADNEPKILRQDFYNSLCAAFTPVEVQKQLVTARLDQFKIEIISDRHMMVYGTFN